MNKKTLWLIIGLLAVLIAAGIALLAFVRVRDAKLFGEVHKVRTYGGTNYVVELLETTVGKVDTGCVLIVYARLINRNPFDVALQRDWFVLMDDDKDYFQPVVASGQQPAIRIPANGTIEKESLQFVVPDDSLRGKIALMIGYRYFALIKSEKPFAGKLRKGQYLNFQQRDWQP